MGRTDEADLIVGVDTHLGTHTDDLRRARPRGVPMQMPATAVGYAQLLAWANTAATGRRAVWAIEGTRHYGLGLARHLTAAGQQVAETGSTRHVGKRRAGKSDPIDAVRAARELLARPASADARRRRPRGTAAADDRPGTTPCNPARPPAPCWHQSWSPHPPSSASRSAPSRVSAGHAPALGLPARR